VPLINRFVHFLPVVLVRVDDEMNPIRDKNDFCVRCRTGEKGLLIGLIGIDPISAYNGYANNSEASKTKVIHNVFKKGQRAFNSGDLMRIDSFGYFYFCDRLGDTFRWRGENVSTIEVENVISRCLSSREVVVYGVEGPGQEGKAGMAAINCQPDAVDLKVLATRLMIELPHYAKPVFLRFVQELEHTGTGFNTFFLL
jgi:solute carrier family 27 fatty acid transporter 1/4